MDLTSLTLLVKIFFCVISYDYELKMKNSSSTEKQEKQEMSDIEIWEERNLYVKRSWKIVKNFHSRLDILLTSRMRSTIFLYITKKKDENFSDVVCCVSVLWDSMMTLKDEATRKKTINLHQRRSLSLYSRDDVMEIEFRSFFFRYKMNLFSPLKEDFNDPTNSIINREQSWAMEIVDFY